MFLIVPCSLTHFMSVVLNGYSLLYSIRDNYICWTIMSQSGLKQYVVVLCYYLTEAVTEIQKMIECTGLEEKANVLSRDRMLKL